MKVLVTGANGFVGRAVVRRLAAAGHLVRAATRSGPAIAGVEWIRIGDIDGDTDWGPALAGIEAVVHLAARCHVLDADTRDPADELALARRVNRDGTARLARACGAGVRFVLMSSIRAVADASHAGFIDEHTPPQPSTPYGLSKLEAERELAAVASARGLSWIALRPPLVLGEGVGGNVQRLIAAVRRGLPLPLAAVHNRRSTIYVGNLADAVARALEPDAAHGIALPLSDGPAHSTAALARAIGDAMTRQPRLWPVPPRWLELGARMLDRGPLWSRLCGDLEIDESTRHRLGWIPAVAFHEAVRRSVHGHVASMRA